MAEKDEEVQGSPSALADMMKNMAAGKPAVADTDVVDEDVDTEESDEVEETDTDDTDVQDDSEEETPETEQEDVVEDDVTEEEEVSDEDDPAKLKRALAKANRERNRHKRRAEEWQSLAVSSSLESELTKAGFNGKIEKVTKFMDLTKVEIKEGKIAGLEDQVKELKADFPALFTEPEKVTKTKPTVNVRKPDTKVAPPKAAPAGDPAINSLLKQAGLR